MLNLSPQWIENVLKADWHSNTSIAAFTGVHFDSRQIEPGHLFLAMKGARHGHEFLQAAQEKGATAAIVEELHREIDLPQLVVPDTLTALQTLARAHRHNLVGKVIALSGSSGKTSTKELLAAVLGKGTHKSPGNFNNHIGLPLTLLQAPIAAPYIILEAGVSEPGEMDLLADIAEPDIALITLIGSAHQEFFGTLENTAAQKGKLLQAIRPGGHAFLHSAEVQFEALANLTADVTVLGNTQLPIPSNYKCERFDLASPESITPKHAWNLTVGEHFYKLPLYTPGMARNAALAAAVADYMGIDADVIARRLARPLPMGIRGSWSPLNANPKHALYLDAYNSNPEALLDSLWCFHQLCDGARHYVIGTMAELGSNAKQIHTDTLQRLRLRPQDCVTLVGDYADAMAEGLTQAGAQASQIERCNDLEKIKSKICKIDADSFVKGSHSTLLYTFDSLC